MVKGDGTSTDGCPLVEREFTDITYADGAVTGTLKVKDSETGGCTAANDVSVTPAATGVALSDHAAAGTGVFELAVDLADGDDYVLAADEQLDPTAGWCEAVQTQKTLTLDTDDDGVRDNVDECVTVKGDGTSTDGCPLVEREFTDITYAGGAVTGTLKVKDSETGGCTAANDVSVTPTATGVPLPGEAAEGTGAFEVAVDLADGDDYLLAADKYLDPGAGWCEAVQTQKTVTLDTDGDGVRDNVDECDHVDGDGTSTDGCPLVEREFTDITYAGGALSGTLRVKDSEDGRVHRCERRVGDPHRDRGRALRHGGPGLRRVRARGGPGRRGRLCPDRGQAARSRRPAGAKRSRHSGPSRSTPMATASTTTWTNAITWTETGRRPMGVRWSSGSSPTSPTPAVCCPGR